MLTVCFVLCFFIHLGFISQIWMLLDLPLCGLHFDPVVSNALVRFFPCFPLYFSVLWIVISR